MGSLAEDYNLYSKRFSKAERPIKLVVSPINCIRTNQPCFETLLKLTTAHSHPTTHPHIDNHYRLTYDHRVVVSPQLSI